RARSRTKDVSKRPSGSNPALLTISHIVLKIPIVPSVNTSPLSAPPWRCDVSVQSDAYVEEVSAERFRTTRQALGGSVRRTPVWAWPAEEVAEWLGDGAELLLKLELLQHASCFKARGAMLHLLSLSADERAGGVITASAGNHAACVAFAANAAGVSAKVVVPRAVSPARLAICCRYGSEV